MANDHEQCRHRVRRPLTARPAELRFQIDVGARNHPVADRDVSRTGGPPGQAQRRKLSVDGGDDVIIGGGVVAFSGLMANGQGQWAAYDGRVIQEYLDTNTNDLYGLIGGTNEAPTSTTGFDGPFPFTGVVTVS